MIIQKYGGTSVSTEAQIQGIAHNVAHLSAQGNPIVVVVSAMGNETERLLNLAHSLSPTPNRRELDLLLSTGEQVTSALLSIALQRIGCAAISMGAAHSLIRTRGVHSSAYINWVDELKLRRYLDAGTVVVVSGFQGVNDEGDITTLGRGGSDLTAVALAAVLKARECQIFTDVQGVYTADPRLVPRAKLLSNITFEEMLEMACFGAQVLQLRAVEFAYRYNVPLRVLSCFEECEGTVIDTEGVNMEDAEIRGIACNRDETRIMITAVPDIPGIAAKLLAPLITNGIHVDTIVQNIAAADSTDLTFTVSRLDALKAVEILRTTVENIGGGEILLDNTIAKISLIGVGVRTHTDIAARMFQILADLNVNILLIAASTMRISVIVKEEAVEIALPALHKAFGLDAAVSSADNLQ